MLETTLKVIGWMAAAYAAGGLVTVLLYWVQGSLDLISCIVLFLTWPLWLLVYLTGGK